MFIQSSIGGQLGCFHVLDIVNISAVNYSPIVYRHLFEILLAVLLGIYPQVELLNRMVIVFFFLKEKNFILL